MQEMQSNKIKIKYFKLSFNELEPDSFTSSVYVSTEIKVSPT